MLIYHGFCKVENLTGVSGLYGAAAGYIGAVLRISLILRTVMPLDLRLFLKHAIQYDYALIFLIRYYAVCRTNGKFFKKNFKKYLQNVSNYVIIILKTVEVTVKRRT